MKTRYFLILFLAVAGLFVASCSKDPGFNGKRSIHGDVTYPGGMASGAFVMIKFDATEPAETYDYTTVTDMDGHYEFDALAPGNYFVTAKYTDANGATFTSPGAKVVLEKNKGEATANLTVE
jgi:hypothetical protein